MLIQKVAGLDVTHRIEHAFFDVGDLLAQFSN